MWWRGEIQREAVEAREAEMCRTLSRMGWRRESVTAQPEDGDGSVTVVSTRTCMVCGIGLNKRQHAKTCSPKCRKALSRR